MKKILFIFCLFMGTINASEADNAPKSASSDTSVNKQVNYTCDPRPGAYSDGLCKPAAVPGNNVPQFIRVRNYVICEKDPRNDPYGHGSRCCDHLSASDGRALGVCPWPQHHPISWTRIRDKLRGAISVVNTAIEAETAIEVAAAIAP